MSNNQNGNYPVSPLPREVSHPTEYVIEKGIPLPAINRKLKPRQPKYPIEAMDVGDSVIIDRPIKSTHAITRYYSIKFKYKRQYSSRSIDATHTRVWRVR